MRYTFIILAFICLSGYSQSVKIDGPTGQVSDLATDTDPATDDLVIMETAAGVSQSITFKNFTEMPHGAVNFHDSAVELVMSTGVWTHVSNPTKTLWSTDDFTDITWGGDTLTIDAGFAGDYMMMIGLSFSGTAGDSYELGLYKNNVQIDTPTTERTTGQTDVGYMGLPAYVPNLVAGDDLKLMIRNTASNDDATIIACSWIIWRLHI